MQFKQKSLQSASVIWSIATVCCALWISCTAGNGSIEAASAQTLAHKPGDDVARLRLIAAPALPDGTYDVGVEIAMTPGSHTYWKQPGEAGVPPVFAFNGSINVAKADVRFPVPSRLSEDGLDAFGYTGTIVFPVAVTPIDARKPSVLKADVTYAVCNKICIPVHSTATVDLGPGQAGVEAGSVAAALALVPRPMTAAERGDLKISPAPGETKQSWQVTWTGPQPLDDLFATVPEGFYFSTRKTGPNAYLLSADQVVVAGAVAKVPVTLVLKKASDSLSTMESLDVRAASR